jgi:putative ABC transport system permease protein
MRRFHPIPLGWLQLWHRKLRFAVALAGIAFAVMLILMQLGFRASLFESAVRYQKRLNYDVAIFSRDSQFIVRPAAFSSRRLYQALAVEGVRAISPVYMYQATWKNPYTLEARSIFALGIDPEGDVLDAPGIAENLPQIRRQDVILFDAASRPEHGPIAERFRAGEAITTEVNDRQVHVGGLFAMGTSFGIDAALVTSGDNFLRLFPSRRRTQIDLGLIRVEDGVDPVSVRDHLRALLPEDVIVMTKADFMARETAYWNSATPIGFVFSFGAIIGLVVGTVIVYQILFSDVSDHLAEYATLRAIGYSNGYISSVVVQQALILALFGYALGALASVRLYSIASAATRLPMELSMERAVAVLGATIAMCAFSGLLALRRVRRLDPAEVF